MHRRDGRRMPRGKCGHDGIRCGILSRRRLRDTGSSAHPGQTGSPRRAPGEHLRQGHDPRQVGQHVFRGAAGGHVREDHIGLHHETDPQRPDWSEPARRTGAQNRARQRKTAALRRPSAHADLKPGRETPQWVSYSGVCEPVSGRSRLPIPTGAGKPHSDRGRQFREEALCSGRHSRPRPRNPVTLPRKAGP